METETQLLGASDIVGKEDFEYREVEVPEWGGMVRLRVISAAEAIQFTEFVKGESKKNAMLKIVALCLCDANGKRLFDDSKLQTLGSKNLKVLMRLQTESLELNGMTSKKKDEVDELALAKKD